MLVIVLIIWGINLFLFTTTFEESKGRKEHGKDMLLRGITGVILVPTTGVLGWNLFKYLVVIALQH